ncbi:MAG TPA: hypothetical protein VGM90_18785 [Kofleriaceae bacterium]
MRTYLIAALLLGACADQAATTGEVEVSEDGDGGKADSAGELSLRAGDTTVWLTQQIERRAGANGTQYVLHGRASRNLTYGNAFIADDPFGDFEQKTARTFEVTWSDDYALMLTSGTNQFVGVEFTHSSSRPDNLTARVQLRPRVLSSSGSSKIYVTAELTPVVVSGETVWRLKAKTTVPNVGVVANSGARTYAATGDQNVTIDLQKDQLFSKEPLVITATLANGTTVQRRISLGLSVKRFGLTTADAYDTWPQPTCTTARTTCLRALGDSALDTASCGEALDVLACQGQVGVRVDDVAFQAANTAAHTRTGSADARADYAALAGADHVEQLQGSLEQTIQAALEQQQGRWYLGTPARDSVFTKLVDGAIASAYAHPVDLVEPHTAVPGNVDSERQVAADALLAYLAQQDYLRSEFGRSYDDLVIAYRAQHVASLKAFRETIVPELYPGSTTNDVLIGDWLGAHTEITIDKATGEATNVLVELD